MLGPLLPAQHGEQHLAECGLLNTNMSTECLIKGSGLISSTMRGQMLSCGGLLRLPIFVHVFISQPVQIQPLLLAGCAAFD